MQKEIDESNELIEHKDMHLATIPELQKFILIGDGAITSYKAKLKTLEKVEIAENVRKQTLKDGQNLSEAVLLVTARLGELLKNIETSHGGSIDGKKGGSKKTIPDSISHKQSFYAQEIYRNPEIVHKIVAKAIDREDIATRHDVLKAIKENKREAKIQEQKKEIEQGLKQPEGLFDIIVIDPPWEFEGRHDNDARRCSGVLDAYPTLSVSELEYIEIPAKEDAIIWLWTTHNWIWDAKHLLRFWNFDYKAILVWDKEKMGIGKWLRLQTEFCLLGVRGKPLWENKGIRDIIREPRTKHSAKPEAFFKMIDDNFTGRKLNYYGRKPREGWEIYGAGQDSISK